MERKYTETDKELMLKLLEMQELTAPISLSIGSVVNGRVTQGIILHEAPPKVVEDLVKDGYSCLSPCRNARKALCGRGQPPTTSSMDWKRP